MTQTRPSDADVLAGYIATWRRACTDFIALAREIPVHQWDLPTDLAGWSVRDNVAHTAHLEAVLAGAPEETIEVPEAAHVKGLMNVYTEQGVLARRGQDLAALVDELEKAVLTRYAALQANPPTELTGTPPIVFAGMPWNNETLLGNRPLDVWMHEQDIRRAIGYEGNYDSPAAIHAIDRLAPGLAMVIGKRVAPPVGTSIRVDVPQMNRSWTVLVGADGRAGFIGPVADPTVSVSLSAEDFVVLAGGRRPASATSPRVNGDQALATRLLEAMAITP